MTYNHFSMDNTEGYDAVQIASLNAMFLDACGEMGIDPCDPDGTDNYENVMQNLGERILADYDVSRGMDRR